MITRLVLRHPDGITIPVRYVEHADNLNLGAALVAIAEAYITLHAPFTSAEQQAWVRAHPYEFAIHAPDDVWEAAGLRRVAIADFMMETGVAGTL